MLFLHHPQCLKHFTAPSPIKRSDADPPPENTGRLNSIFGRLQPNDKYMEMANLKSAHLKSSTQVSFSFKFLYKHWSYGN